MGVKNMRPVDLSILARARTYGVNSLRPPLPLEHYRIATPARRNSSPAFLNPTPTPAASAVLHRQTPFHLAAYSRGHFTFRAVRRVEMTHFSALLVGSHEPIAYYYHSRG
jgi:hypothetical protein